MAKRNVKKCRQCGSLKVQYKASRVIFMKRTQTYKRFVWLFWQCNRCNYRQRIIREVQKESGRKELSGLLIKKA